MAAARFYYTNCSVFCSIVDQGDIPIGFGIQFPRRLGREQHILGPQLTHRLTHQVDSLGNSARRIKIIIMRIQYNATHKTQSITPESTTKHSNNLFN